MWIGYSIKRTLAYFVWTVSLDGWSPIWLTKQENMLVYVCYKAAKSEPVKLETSHTLILPPTVSDLCLIRDKAQSKISRKYLLECTLRKAWQSGWIMCYEFSLIPLQIWASPCSYSVLSYYSTFLPSNKCENPSIHLGCILCRIWTHTISIISLLP